MHFSSLLFCLSGHTCLGNSSTGVVSFIRAALNKIRRCNMIALSLLEILSVPLKVSTVKTVCNCRFGEFVRVHQNLTFYKSTMQINFLHEGIY